jgi:hypothetical protein
VLTPAVFDQVSREAGFPWTPTTMTLYPSGNAPHHAAYPMEFRNGRARPSEYTRDVSVGIGLLGRLLARLGIRKAR